jgi:hypothetical protein
MALAAEQPFDLPQHSAWRSRLAALRSPALLTLLACVALSLAIFGRAWTDPGARLAGVGDPALFAWTFRWLPFAVSHGLNPLFTNYLDYPSGMNLMWSANTILLGLLLSPVTLAMNSAVAYNLAATLGPALSAWCAFLAIRRYVARWPFAAAGGFLYGFAPGMMAQASFGHLHVTFAVFPPLVLLIASEIFVRRRVRPFFGGLLLGLLAGLQVLLGEETLVLTAVAGAIAVLIALIELRSEARQYIALAIRAVIVASIAFVVVGGLPIAEQMLGPQHVHGPLQAPNFYVTDLLNFVVPSPLQVISPSAISWLSAHFTGDASSRDAYLGLPLLAWFFIASRRQWGDRVVRWSALVTLALAVLSLGPALHVAGVVTHIPLPWTLVQGLPGLENVLPGRFMVLAMLPAALLLARALDRNLSSGRFRLELAVPAIGMLFLVPNLQPATTPMLPEFFVSSSVQRLMPGDVVLVAPYSGVYSTDAMYWQAASGMRFRMPEGYGVVPGSLLNPPPSRMQQAMVEIERDGTAPSISSAVVADLRRELASWHVRTVIAGPMPHRELMIALLTQVLGQSPDVDGGVDVWWTVPSPGGLQARP